MPVSKLLSLSEAIDRFVPDDSSIAMGLAQETLIPFAAGHELIRQNKKRLTLIGPISDILFDQIIGAGCVRKIRAAWVGNVITGSCYNFRRGVENGTLEMEDHSNLTLAMALLAGAMGVSFMPARTALGSDLFKTNASLKTMTCPFSGDILTAVGAINPDVAIVHLQRADKFGNAHAWGNLGLNRDPNRVITPGFRVSAVVHAPWGGHPSPVPGYYNRDHQGFIDYRNQSKTSDDFAKWKKYWVDDVRSPLDYTKMLGDKRIAGLAIKHHDLSEQVDYGY